MPLLPALVLLAGLQVSPDALQVTDIDGRSHDLRGQTTAFVFVKTTCPIANYYHPTLQRLSEQWPDTVELVVVHTERARTVDELKKHRDDYNVPGIVVHDPEAVLVEVLDARITPEAVVVDAIGSVRYRGRIDDTYLGFGKRRQFATSHELRDAVAAVEQGKLVAVSVTKAVGCIIRRRKNETSPQ